MRTFSGNGHSPEDVRQAAAHLKGQACTMAARLISDGILRLQFNRESTFYIKNILNDVEPEKLSTEKALKSLEDETKSLSDQYLDLTIRGIGFVARVAQMTVALVFREKTSKLTCCTASTLLLVHGASNTYENTRNIIYNR